MLTSGATSNYRQGLAISEIFKARALVSACPRMRCQAHVELIADEYSAGKLTPAPVERFQNVIPMTCRCGEASCVIWSLIDTQHDGHSTTLSEVVQNQFQRAAKNANENTGPLRKPREQPRPCPETLIQTTCGRSTTTTGNTRSTFARRSQQLQLATNSASPVPRL